MQSTIEQFNEAFDRCRSLFIAKLKDYGPSWRLMRPSAVTDQILIKADRIRTLESGAQARVTDENISDGFTAIVNYGIIALIQCQLGFASTKDISVQKATALYDEEADITRKLMLDKNHDYGEAWRKMRVSSFTDLILMKIMRTKEIEDNNGIAHVSEGVDANYRDMINYAIFALIKLAEDQPTQPATRQS